MIKCPEFVGEEEIQKRERIERRIISFNFFIKHQSDVIDRKERMCVTCPLYSIGSWRVK